MASGHYMKCHEEFIPGLMKVCEGWIRTLLAQRSRGAQGGAAVFLKALLLHRKQLNDLFWLPVGSNLLLQKLLTKKGVPENCQLLAMDYDTTICPVFYVSNALIYGSCMGDE